MLMYFYLLTYLDANSFFLFLIIVLSWSYTGSLYSKDIFSTMIVDLSFVALIFRLPSFYCDIGYQGGGGYHPNRFSVRFKILYRVI